jgi:uncharacterized YccA/Bax inhibitor family protein
MKTLLADQTFLQTQYTREVIMIFKRKYDRALDHVKDTMKDREKTYENDDLNSVMEKGDTRAMIIAALITIVPICLLILVVISLIAYFFIVRGW